MKMNDVEIVGIKELMRKIGFYLLVGVVVLTYYSIVAWGELVEDQAQVSQTIELIAEGHKANYALIRDSMGEANVKSEKVISKKKGALWARVFGYREEDFPIIRTREAMVSFKCDHRSDKLWCDYKTVKEQRIKKETNEELLNRNRLFHEIGILTSGRYITFQPEDKHAESDPNVIAGVSPERGYRILIRSPEEGRRLVRANLFDPRYFFKYGANDILIYLTHIREYVDQASKAGYPVKVETIETEGTKLVTIIMSGTRHSGYEDGAIIKGRQEMKFNEKQGYNLVYLANWEGHFKRDERVVTYVNYGNIWFPEKVVISRYNRDAQGATELRYRREIVFQNVILNSGIPPESFELSAIKAPKGTKVVDLISKTEYPYFPAEEVEEVKPGADKD